MGKCTVSESKKNGKNKTASETQDQVTSSDIHVVGVPEERMRKTIFEKIMTKGFPN